MPSWVPQLRSPAEWADNLCSCYSGAQDARRGLALHRPNCRCLNPLHWCSCVTVVCTVLWGGGESWKPPWGKGMLISLPCGKSASLIDLCQVFCWCLSEEFQEMGQVQKKDKILAELLQSKTDLFFLSHTQPHFILPPCPIQLTLYPLSLWASIMGLVHLTLHSNSLVLCDSIAIYGIKKDTALLEHWHDGLFGLGLNSQCLFYWHLAWNWLSAWLLHRSSVFSLIYFVTLSILTIHIPWEIEGFFGPNLHWTICHLVAHSPNLLPIQPF